MPPCEWLSAHCPQNAASSAPPVLILQASCRPSLPDEDCWDIQPQLLGSQSLHCKDSHHGTTHTVLWEFNISISLQIHAVDLLSVLKAAQPYSCLPVSRLIYCFPIVDPFLLSIYSYLWLLFVQKNLVDLCQRAGAVEQAFRLGPWLPYLGVGLIELSTSVVPLSQGWWGLWHSTVGPGMVLVWLGFSMNWTNSDSVTKRGQSEALEKVLVLL